MIKLLQDVPTLLFCFSFDQPWGAAKPG
jgi:hypothetical protein